MHIILDIHKCNESTSWSLINKLVYLKTNGKRRKKTRTKWLMSVLMAKYNILFWEMNMHKLSPQMTFHLVDDLLPLLTYYLSLTSLEQRGSMERLENVHTTWNVPEVTQPSTVTPGNEQNERNGYDMFLY